MLKCPSLIPLETEIIKNFSPKELIVVTDAGLCSKENKTFNDTATKRYITVNPVRKMGETALENYMFDEKKPWKTTDLAYDNPQKIWKKYNKNLANIEFFLKIVKRKQI